MRTHTTAEERAWYAFAAYAPAAPITCWEDVRADGLSGQLGSQRFRVIADALLPYPEAEHKFTLWIDAIKAARLAQAKAPVQREFTLQ